MQSIEEFSSDGQLLCYIIRTAFQPERTTFLTPPELNLQAGYIVYPDGHEITRHVHHRIERHISGTMEVLVVRRGACEIDIYDNKREKVATRQLREGDITIMVSGGHGFRMLEDTVLIEIKQGPYPGVEEKETF